MLLTEEEAKKKWCPNFAIANTILAGVSRMGGNENKLQLNNACIASECMMWRRGEDRTEYEQDIDNTAYGPFPVAQGYCGLAGKL